MASGIRNNIKTLERLSLVTCSIRVLSMLERTLANVQPLLKADTRGVEPMIWQNKLSFEKLNPDVVNNRLGPKDLEKNASGFFEDYIAVGPLPNNKCKTNQSK